MATQTKILYEFITPSDPITFYAPDNDIAEAVSIYVGNGKAGTNRADEKDGPHTLIAFSSWGEGQEERVSGTMSKRINEVIEAAHTFAVTSIADRPVYDDYTNNGQDKEKIDKWDDIRRSSMSDWCGYARGLKLKE